MNASDTQRSSARGSRADAGVLSLEFAMVIPLFFVLALLMLQVTGTARDALMLQNAAREGARAAATHAGDREVAAVVTAALDGRTAVVSVTPRTRRAGDLVRVRVAMTSVGGRLSLELRAQAAARVEPVRR